jgi:hypothetical protein
MRRITIVLLSVGAIAGFSAGLIHLIHGPCRIGRHDHGPWSERRAEFEQHVAEICTEAAHKVMAKEVDTPSGAPSPP